MVISNLHDRQGNIKQMFHHLTKELPERLVSEMNNHTAT